MFSIRNELCLLLVLVPVFFWCLPALSAGNFIRTVPSQSMATSFYQKHPWLVKGAGVAFAGVVGIALYRDYQRQQQKLLTAAAENTRIEGLQKLLFEAIKQGDIEHVKALIAQKVTVNCMRPIVRKRQSGEMAPFTTEHCIDGTPLLAAAWDGRADMVQVLLEAGAWPNYARYDGPSPLILMVEAQNLAGVEALTRAGADVNFQPTRGGGSSLCRASLKGNFLIIKELLRAGGKREDLWVYADLVLAAEEENFVAVKDYFENKKLQWSILEPYLRDMIWENEEKKNKVIDTVKKMYGNTIADKLRIPH